MDNFFFQAFVFLAAAVISVPIAKRLGLGSVLGYLLAGALIGPFGLGLLGQESEAVMHFAEFGVVMMLFLIGLELEPALLWRMRNAILGLGGLQVLLTSLVIAATAWSLGLVWQQALTIGMVLALSSTALVLQSLQEKGLSRTTAGKSAFAVLLFQDIAIIPMMAFFPLLATMNTGAKAETSKSWIADFPASVQSIFVLLALASLVVLGRYGVRPMFRIIARTRLREIFVAAALLLVIGVDLLMVGVGLSPALGTFLAGVVLASSEYRHELESDIEPFKGLLLGLFFLAVGASLNLGIVAQHPLDIALLVVALMVGKWILLMLLGRGFRLSLDQNMTFAFALAQGGEFAFVLFSFANQRGVLPSRVTAPLIVAVTISMALTPLAMLVFEKVIRPRVGTKESPRQFDEIHEQHQVIIAGFGRFGQICGRLLHAEGIGTTVLEYDSDQVDLLRKFGRHVYYGDASRYDLLQAAGADQAKLLILALDQPDKALEIVHAAKKHFPHMQIVARARGRVNAYELIEAGVEHVFRETFDSSLQLGVRALELLGYRRHRAHQSALRFRRSDETLLHTFASQRNEDSYIDRVTQANQEAEAILRADAERERRKIEDYWDSDAPSLAGEASL